jgi:hypothetical protein
MKKGFFTNRVPKKQQAFGIAAQSFEFFSNIQDQIINQIPIAVDGSLPYVTIFSNLTKKIHAYQISFEKYSYILKFLIVMNTGLFGKPPTLPYPYFEHQTCLFSYFVSL